MTKYKVQFTLEEKICWTEPFDAKSEAIMWMKEAQSDVEPAKIIEKE